MIRLAYFLILILITGCNSTQYYWGSYEDNIYNTYNNPDLAVPEKQIETMEADMEVARSKDKALPPGFHAQLGYLYYQIGKIDFARSEFILEMEQYPESKKLMKRFIAKLEGRK